MAKPSNHNSQVWDERRSVLLRSGRSGPQVRLTSELVTHQSFIDNFIKKLVLLRLELFLSTQPCFAIYWCNVMYCNCIVLWGQMHYVLYFVLLFNREKNSKSSPASTASTIVEESESVLSWVLSDWLRPSTSSAGPATTDTTLLLNHQVSMMKVFCQHVWVQL